MSRLLRAALLMVLTVGAGSAHIGSPDIYLDGNAGPYKLFVTIRPPLVIPGVAELQVRSESSGVTEIKAVPLPLGEMGSDHPAVPDLLSRSANDGQFFTGALWLMADGSWQVRLMVNGSQGAATLSIPVPAVAQQTRRMDVPLGVGLSIVGLFLVGGLVAICGATVREAKLEPGLEATPAGSRRGIIAMVVSFVVIGAVLYGAKKWWDSEAAVYQGRIYKPMTMSADLNGSSNLDLNLSEPGWMQPQKNKLSRILFTRKLDDLVPDHDHLMHLYAIRQPNLDVVYHLHPEMTQPEHFSIALPEMPPGDYKLYADVVHEDGLPETLTSTLSLPNGISSASGKPLSGDDAKAETDGKGLSDTFTLPDGYQMRWIHNSDPIEARQGMEFHFELLTPDGAKPSDMALYMGMQGHAAFVKTDGTVFAHIHPNGTVAMAALMLAQGDSNPMVAMDHSKAHMNGEIPNDVAFPYGLPSAGDYRIFVQMKHGQTVETGIFNASAR